jgi:hypothetical protein
MVKVILLTRFGMIWVHLCQKHMFSIESYNLQSIAQIYAKITVLRQFCLNSSNNRFFPIIIDYKNSFYFQNTTDIKKSALSRCKVTIKEYVA